MPAKRSMSVGDVVLGLDLGSSSCKVVAIDPCGRVYAQASARYPTMREGDRIEQDPASWEKATVLALTGAIKELSEAGVDTDCIKAIGLTGQIGTHLLLDKNYRPLAPAVTWQDRRSQVCVDVVLSELGRETLRKWLGIDLPPSNAWPVTRLCWFRRSLGRLWSEVRWVVQPRDYIGLRLTGRLASDPSSSRGVLAYPTCSKSKPLFEWLRCDLETWPEVVGSTEILGLMRDEMVDRLGLKRAIPVVIGINDLNAAVIGTTPHGVGIGFDVTGTSEHIGSWCPGEYLGRPAGAAMYCPGDEHYALCYGVTSNSGSAVEWAMQVFGVADLPSLMGLAEQAPAGAGGVSFLPYLNGERSPIWDPEARGVFFGLHGSSTRSDVLRAVFEGVTFALSTILEAVQAQTPRMERVIVSGGAAGNDFWNQLKSDIFQCRIECAQVLNGAAHGAAILASVGAGIHSSTEQATRLMLHTGRVFEPDPSKAEIYQEGLAKFKRIYASLAPLRRGGEEVGE